MKAAFKKFYQRLTSASLALLLLAGSAGAVAPLFVSKDVDALPLTTYKLTAAPSIVTVDAGSVGSLYAFAEFKSLFGGWNDFIALLGDAAITATVSGDAEVSTDQLTWGTTATITTTEGLNKVDGTFYLQAATAGTYPIDLSADIVTLEGARTLTATASLVTNYVTPTCDTDNTTFDTFTNGSVNGQFGWKVTNPNFNQAIVQNTYGFDSFGCQSLRISNSFTSGSFGDQVFSYETADEAGETDALNNGQSGGTRQNRFEAQFDIASTSATQQPGLTLSVSPDRGDGARMSYLRFEDKADGIHVFFDDVTTTTNPAAWNEWDIATLSRTAPHTIKFVIDFVDGPSNDVVNIYIDGTLVHTGTTWENYYRFDDESNPTLQDNSRTVDSLLIRVAGTAVPAHAGKGFLFDNVVLSTSTVQTTPAEDPETETPASTVDVPAPFTPIVASSSNTFGQILATTTNTEQTEGEVEGATEETTGDEQAAATEEKKGLNWFWFAAIAALLFLLFARRKKEEPAATPTKKK